MQTALQTLQLIAVLAAISLAVSIAIGHALHRLGEPHEHE